MTVQEITSAEQFKELVDSGKVVVVDFYAIWCGPCKAIAPTFDKSVTQQPTWCPYQSLLTTAVDRLSEKEKFKDLVFARIDVDQLDDLSNELDIRSMPTFQLYINGEKAGEAVGPSPGELEDFVSKGLES
ncbi:hypothetical protein ACJZ2D_007174 [Fusarium nematophilum]